jgi:hypothetical protein
MNFEELVRSNNPTKIVIKNNPVVVDKGLPLSYSIGVAFSVVLGLAMFEVLAYFIWSNRHRIRSTIFGDGVTTDLSRSPATSSQGVPKSRSYIKSEQV